MVSYIWRLLPSTLAVFFGAHKLAARFKMPLLNSLLVAMAIIIPIPLLTGIPHDHYFKGSEVPNDLLRSAMVTLVYPLYGQLRQIRARWKSIIAICLVGDVTAMVTSITIALLMGVSPQIAASTMPRSVTTPIAMAVGGSVGGVLVISAVCVIFIGIPRAVSGHTLLNATYIRTKAVHGLAIGTALYALGTTRCAGLDYQGGTFSSLVLVIYGIITPLVTPSLSPIILAVAG